MTKQDMVRRANEYVKETGATISDGTIEFMWSLILDGRTQGTCDLCGETFVMVRKDQKFCKRECKRSAHNQMRKRKEKGKDYEK